MLCSADFVSLHKGQVQLFWSQLIQVQTLPSAKLVQIIFDRDTPDVKELRAGFGLVCFTRAAQSCTYRSLDVCADSADSANAITS